MTLKYLSICGLIFTICISCQTQSSKSRIEIVQFESDIFKNTRSIRIYLPADYESRGPYEVLYLNDGQNLFQSDSLKRIDYWRVDQIADSLIERNLIQPIIIVGIDNLGLRQRANEYLPWEDIYLHPPNPNPQGTKYPKFITDELVPFINQNFKTKTGRMNTAVGGFSYGGLISAYSALIDDHFGKLLIESPSLYVSEQRIFSELSKKEMIPKMKIYAGIGTNELDLKNCDELHDDNLMAVNDVKSLISLINERSPDSEIHFEKTKCGIHSYFEASKRLPTALTFLYGKNR